MAAWFLIPFNSSYFIVAVLFIIAVLYKKEQRFAHAMLSRRLSLNSDLFLHSIVAISYVILMSSLREYPLDLFIAPALSVHGALILFLKNKRLTRVKYSFGLILLGIIKLAMIDAVNALLWQKVVLFMGVGVFILIASFWYQKLVNEIKSSNI